MYYRDSRRRWAHNGLEVTGAACDDRRADATNGAPPDAVRRAEWCRRRPVHRRGCAGKHSDQADGCNI